MLSKLFPKILDTIFDKKILDTGFIYASTIGIEEGFQLFSNIIHSISKREFTQAYRIAILEMFDQFFSRYKSALEKQYMRDYMLVCLIKFFLCGMVE